MFIDIIEGLLVGVAILVVTLVVVHLKTGGKAGDPFNFGDFDKLLAIYIDITKFILGLASGSIVLLVGFAFGPNGGGKVPHSLISPLCLLVVSILYGILFMVFLLTDYESSRHFQDFYTRFKYVRNRTLGFSGLMCFLSGYFWLVINVTNGR